MSDTQFPTVPPPPPSEWPPPTVQRPSVGPRRLLTGVLAGLGLVGAGAVVAASILPSSLLAEAQNPLTMELDEAPYAYVPATASSVNETIDLGEVEGALEVYEPSGDFLFVTVLKPKQTVLSYLANAGDPSVRFITDAEANPFQDPSQQTTIGLEMMRTSKDVAQYVAFNQLGLDVDIEPGRVVIWYMLCLEPSADGSTCVDQPPAADVLQAGDELIAVDGVEIGTLVDLEAALSDKSGGSEVTVTFSRRNEDERTETIELVEGPEGRALIGFRPFDTAAVDLNGLSLDIDTDRVGGPSAGFAFTLTLIDELSPGELTGGRKIAVTGAINLDGTTGAIGGLAQKTEAVRQAGAEIFLVPASQSPESLAAARRVAADDVEVIPVASVDEALEVLEGLGGDPVEPIDG